MKKTVRTSLKRIISIFLVSIMLLGSLVPIFATEGQENVPQTISDGIYMLKNKHTEKYLTLPGYFEYTSGKNNVYQDATTINDQYSRAVRVTYTTSGYTITPLLYENFGYNYLVALGSGNVIISSLDKIDTSTDKYTWTIEYIEGSNAYKLSCNEKYLDAVDQLNGSVTGTGFASAGNIIMRYYGDLWEFEPVTVNPHIFKSNSVTKKNIGMNNEWLFKLSDSEMNNCSITDCIVSGNTNLVQVARSGNYVVVKIKDDGNSDKSNDYAVISMTVTYKNKEQTRMVVVQNSGTGNGDGCITRPFTSDPHLYTVTIEEEKDYLLTFKSNLGNVNICNWDVENKFGSSCLEFVNISGTELFGSNFAIVKAKDVGVAMINAYYNDTNAYKMLIEVQKNENGELKTSPQVLNMYDTYDEEPYTLECKEEYLIKATGNVTSADEDGWLTDSEECGEIEIYGDNFILFSTRTSRFTWLVQPEKYYTERIIAVVPDNEEFINLQKEKPIVTYIEDGKYYIENDSSSKFLTPNGDSNVRLEDFGAQDWQFIYLQNGYYAIVFNKTGKALAIKDGEAALSNASVVQAPYDPTSPYQQWHIRIELTDDGEGLYNSNYPYYIVNRASQEAGAYSYRLYCDGNSIKNKSFYYGENNGQDEDDYEEAKKAYYRPSYWDITSSVFNSYTLNSNLVYTISSSDSGLYWTVGNEHNFALISSSESAGGTTIPVAWRFDPVPGNSDYYRIFSMSIGDGNKPLAYNGSIVVFSDTTEILDEQLWIIRRYGDYVYFSPKSEPDKFFTRKNNGGVGMSEFNTNNSAWRIDNFAYTEYYGGDLNIVNNEIYCIVDSSWSNAPLSFRELSNIVTQWNGISSKINLILSSDISDVPAGAYYINIKFDDAYYTAFGQTKCYTPNENDYSFSNPEDPGIHATWSKTDIVIYQYVLDRANNVYIDVETLGEDVLEGTILHEIGHALKLKHAPNNALAIMHPSDVNINNITNFDKTALINKWEVTQ